MIKALENLSNRITVNYEEKPCYDIVFSDSFTNLLVELEKFNIKKQKIMHRYRIKSWSFIWRRTFKSPKATLQTDYFTRI